MMGIVIHDQTQIKIFLFGGFRVQVNERVVPAERWELRRARTLVKYLSLADYHRMPREQLMDLLWPNQDLETTQKNFHQALYIARRVIGGAAETLSLQGDLVCLCPQGELWSDVQAFETAADSAHTTGDPVAFQKAIALYSGELLPEDRYDEWIGQRREVLRQQYHRLLLEYARINEQRQFTGQAVETLEKLVLLDPLLEEAHAALMRLYTLSGKRQKALSQYQSVKSILMHELESEPGPELVRLYEEILEGNHALLPGDRRAAVLKPGPAHHLPVRLSRFIGREQEIARVKELLAGSRLVTLTGSGGVGKTRLAIQVAGLLEDEFADGIWMVNLAGVSRSEHIFQAFQSALGAMIDPSFAGLSEFFRGKQALVILDNCEHLVEACAWLASSLLANSPRLKLLLTSREALGIEGETVYRVPSLGVPAAGLLPALEDFLGVEGVQLLVDRARSSFPAFEVGAQDIRAIAQVLRRLDGIPLAIELAAVYLNLLTPAELARKLGDTFALLDRSGSITALPRHQTLRSTIDWSYQLLSDMERLLMQRLSVFSDGCTLEGMEVVCSGQGIEKDEILNLLARLVRKSMVTPVLESRPQPGVETRYTLLETVRQYALEKLVQSGAEQELRNRHLDYFVDFARRADPQLLSAGREQWNRRVRAELDNLFAAVAWAYIQRNAEAGLTIAMSLGRRFSHTNSLRAETVHMLAEGLMISVVSPLPPMLLAKIYHVIGRLENNENNPENGLFLEKSIALCREIGPAAEGELTWALGSLADYRYCVTQDLSVMRPIADESIQVGSRLGPENAWFYAHALWQRSYLLTFSPPDYDQACRDAEESMRLFRQSGDIWTTSAGWWTIGNIAMRRGDYARASQCHLEALQASRGVDMIATTIFSFILAVISARQGEYSRAIQYLQENILMLVYKVGNCFSLGDSLSGMSTLLILKSLDRPPVERKKWLILALHLHAAAREFESPTDDIYIFTELRKLEQQAQAHLSKELSEEERSRAVAEGLKLTIDQAATLALGISAD